MNGNYSESYYVDSFLSGLKEEISSALYLNKLTTLKNARDKARRQESLIEVKDKRSKGYNKISVGGTSSKQSTGPVAFSTGTKESSSKPLPTGVKKLTYSEMMERRSNGLCFNCDEKFNAGHQCKNKQVFMITTEEESNSTTEQESLNIIWDTEEECNPWGNSNLGNHVDEDLSLHAITGTQG